MQAFLKRHYERLPPLPPPPTLRAPRWEEVAVCVVLASFYVYTRTVWYGGGATVSLLFPPLPPPLDMLTTTRRCLTTRYAPHKYAPPLSVKFPALWSSIPMWASECFDWAASKQRRDPPVVEEYRAGDRILHHIGRVDSRRPSHIPCTLVSITSDLSVEKQLLAAHPSCRLRAFLAAPLDGPAPANTSIHYSKVTGQTIKRSHKELPSLSDIVYTAGDQFGLIDNLIIDTDVEPSYFYFENFFKRNAFDKRSYVKICQINLRYNRPGNLNALQLLKFIYAWDKLMFDMLYVPVRVSASTHDIRETLHFHFANMHSPECVQRYIGPPADLLIPAH